MRSQSAPARILVDLPDGALAEAGGIVGVMAVDGETIAVVAVQPVIGPEPHEAVAILEDGPYRALGEALLDGEVLEAERG